MSKINTITLFTLSNTTSRINIELLKDYLRRTMPDIQLNYYICNFDKSDYNIADVIAMESAIAMKESDLIIGLDGNVDETVLLGNKCKKVLLLSPESRIFSEVMKTKKGMEKYIKGYDYLITGSSYWDDCFRPICSKMGIVLIENINHPVITEMKNLERKSKAWEVLAKRYPEIIGKRIFSVLTSGNRRFPKKNQYTLIDMEELLSSMPADVVLVTNCLNLRYASRFLPMKYSDKFIYFAENDILLEVLLNSEWAITNIAFAGAVDIGKTVEMMHFSYNYFENYIANKYKRACIETPDELSARILDIIHGDYISPNYEERFENFGDIQFNTVLKKLIS